MRFLPPLVISQADLAAAADEVEAVLSQPLKPTAADPGTPD
jgi:hypothetical protein